jgi:hypothetical protein
MWPNCARGSDGERRGTFRGLERTILMRRARQHLHQRWSDTCGKVRTRTAAVPIRWNNFFAKRLGKPREMDPRFTQRNQVGKDDACQHLAAETVGNGCHVQTGAVTV